MHRIFHCIISLAAGVLGAGILATAMAATDQLPPVSGMALIEGRDFLVVVDTKADSDAVRCGVVSVGEAGGYTFEPLLVPWPGERANDLESACPIPGRLGEFLVAESGAWVDPATGAEHPGRIFHLRLSREAGAWRALVVNTLPLDPKLKEVEGMACVLTGQSAAEIAHASAYIAGNYSGPALFTPDVPQPEEAAPAESESPAAVDKPAAPAMQWLIALGTRGASTAYEPARLYTGHANLDAGTWTGKELEGSDVASRANYYQAESPWLRGITDMYIDPSGMLWIARAVDPGDSGPFTSYICRYMKLGQDERYMSYMDSPNDAGWTIRGFKVEALAAPVIPGSVASFATDDESYGGVWRPLEPQ
jgi:hypothetical protein